ncbi:MAG: hydrolase [Patescibacteria group bacterium]
MNNQLQNDQVCCPQFDVARWDGKEFNWENKPFIKESIPTFFHMPLPSMIGSKITKMWKMVEDAKMVAEDKGSVLVLFSDPTAFRSDIHISTTGVVPDAKNVTLSGTFVAKVFDGGYNSIPKFIGQMNQYLAGQNKKAKEYYIHYAYCPKCAQKFGNNYMILFARV